MVSIKKTSHYIDLAHLFSWHTPNSKAGDMTVHKIGIIAINKKEATNLVNEKYPSFEFDKCFSKSTATQTGGYYFRRE